MTNKDNLEEYFLEKTSEFLSLQGDDIFAYGPLHLNAMDWTISKLDMSFYSGLAGIMLAFSAGYYVHQKSSYYNYAKKIYEQLETQIDNQSYEFNGIGFSDLGGILVASYLTKQWLNLKTDLCTHLISITEKLLHQKSWKHDMNDGYAGLLLALTNLKKKQMIPNHLQEYCVQQLMSHYVNDWWPQKYFEKPHCGFAHGYSGYALSFFRYAQQIKNTQLLQFSLDLLEKEDHYFNEQHQSWPDLRVNNKTFKEAWCHGSGGIYLTRCSIQNEGIKINKEKISIALNNVLNKIEKTENHSLCHGSLGLTESLLQANATKKIMNHLDQLKNKKTLTGLPKHIESPSFMTGYSGMAYQILRLQNPDKIPNILLLEI